MEEKIRALEKVEMREGKRRVRTRDWERERERELHQSDLTLCWLLSRMAGRERERDGNGAFCCCFFLLCFEYCLVCGDGNGLLWVTYFGKRCRKGQFVFMGLSLAYDGKRFFRLFGSKMIGSWSILCFFFFFFSFSFFFFFFDRVLHLIGLYAVRCSQFWEVFLHRTLQGWFPHIPNRTLHMEKWEPDYTRCDAPCRFGAVHSI